MKEVKAPTQKEYMKTPKIISKLANNLSNKIFLFTIQILKRFMEPLVSGEWTQIPVADSDDSLHSIVVHSNIFLYMHEEKKKLW